jgi:hypothetical protein
MWQLRGLSDSGFEREHFGRRILEQQQLRRDEQQQRLGQLDRFERFERILLRRRREQLGISGRRGR